jgi:hypothetical protein
VPADEALTNAARVKAATEVKRILKKREWEVWIRTWSKRKAKGIDTVKKQ